MSEWKSDADEKFTILSGCITYSGAGEKIAVVSTGNYSINGVKMIHCREYILRDGDILKDEDFTGIQAKDLKWNFKAD